MANTRQLSSLTTSCQKLKLFGARLRELRHDGTLPKNREDVGIILKRSGKQVERYERAESKPKEDVLLLLAKNTGERNQWLLEPLGLEYDVDNEMLVPRNMEENTPRNYTPITTHRYCPKCAREVELDWDYCYWCHKKLPPQEMR